MRLSRNHTLAELCFSETALRCGLDNAPPEELLPNLRRLAEGLEQVRALLGPALEVSSAYRGGALNEAVGGAPSSHHVLGWAADFTCPDYGPPLQIALALAASSIAFDTLILEYGRWVHISFAPEARRRIMSIYEDATGYRDGLWDAEGIRQA